MHKLLILANFDFSPDYFALSRCLVTLLPPCSSLHKIIKLTRKLKLFTAPDLELKIFYGYPHQSAKTKANMRSDRLRRLSSVSFGVRYIYRLAAELSQSNDDFDLDSDRQTDEQSDEQII